MTIKVTFDTNCFFDYFYRDPKHIAKLIDLQSEGCIEIAVTTRLVADTLDVAPNSRIWDKIRTISPLQVIGSVLRCGMSRAGSEDFCVSEAGSETIEQLCDVMKGASTEDVDHLFGHIMADRDLFVTSDKHFLAHQDKLLHEFGVVVLKPEDAVKNVELRRGNCDLEHR